MYRYIEDVAGAARAFAMLDVNLSRYPGQRLDKWPAGVDAVRDHPTLARVQQGLVDRLEATAGKVAHSKLTH